MSSRLQFDERDERCARWMFDKIQKMAPGIIGNKLSFDVWADDIRKLRKIDGCEYPEIKLLFEYANAHHFWQSVILSPANLRKNRVRLLLEINRGKHGKHTISTDDLAAALSVGRGLQNTSAG
jgi:hypothetical protein